MYCEGMSAPLTVLQGRRFGCTQCGNCCFEPGYVYMSSSELQAIAEYLQMSKERFRARYLARWDPASRQWMIDATHGHGCPLLTEDRGCSVQAVKPMQCQTFPFWDEMLDDARTWEEAKSFCPGLDAPEGRLYSAEEIRRIRNFDGGT